MERGRTPGHRAGLTRTAVLGAARELVTERGLAALTMRTLASRLDVAPNALYSHVANKTALIDYLLDDVLADVEVPAADIDDPVAGLHQLMASTYTVLLTHPDLVPHYLSCQGAHGPNAHRLGDITTALLRRADVSEPAASEALRVLIVYTIGFAAFTSRLPPGTGTEHQPSAAEMLDNFNHGLGWLLTGIQQGRPAPGQAPA
ncbi:TetR/AcrR family transcriptional regulator [Micromonospora sp. DR5-3]|uniref:TetR/AcrR family transcriptional regulator n=1 Tax=unclassified Micromonospora TaxID=2617518 RepID=UPI0016524CE8|nr:MULTISPECIES: TetR/AcrR family transcriptional regulator [unclassified Micromonospora]MCW3816390.1 TetR/AcrR family transcriptional regulator [Micromonospora sp. DR5-3]